MRLERLSKKSITNTYEILGNITFVFTAKRERFVIDTEMLYEVEKFSWCVGKTGYLVANIRNRVVKLQRYLLEVDDREIAVDHINGDRMDNRLCNLRKCTRRENSYNAKVLPSQLGITGVRRTENGKYRAEICHNFKNIYLGRFNTLEEAIKVRQEAELKYFGEFAPHLRNA